MIDQYAQTLSEQNGAFFMLLGVASLLLGFVLAQFIPLNYAVPMHRVSYWLRSNILVFAIMLTPLVWLMPNEIQDPIALGRLYLGAYAFLIVNGYFAGLCARGRSLSMRGHGRWAWISMVPLLGIVLYFWRPIAMFRDGVKSNIFSSLVSIIAGFALLFLSDFITKPYLKSYVEKYVPVFDYDFNFGSSPKDTNRLGAGGEIAQEIKSSSLGDTLWQFAKNPENSVWKDSGVILKDINSSDTTLQYEYIIATEMVVPLDIYRPKLIDLTCRQPALQVFLKAGVAVDFGLFDLAENTIGTIMIKMADCQKAAPVEDPPESTQD